MVAAVFLVAVPKVDLIGLGFYGDEHDFLQFLLLNEEGDEDDVILVEFREERGGINFVDFFLGELVDCVGVDVEDAVGFLRCAALAV